MDPITLAGAVIALSCFSLYWMDAVERKYRAERKFAETSLEYTRLLTSVAEVKDMGGQVVYVAFKTLHTTN